MHTQHSFEAEKNSCELPDFEAAKKNTPEIYNQILGKIGPQTYKLHFPNEFKTDNARIFIIACQGSGSERQRQVADLMNRIAMKEEPLIILVGGDNIYNTGASSPTDEKFKDCFYNIYYRPELTALNKTPSWVLLGNHDGKYDKKSAYYNRYATYPLGLMQVGFEVEKQEILATYLATPTKSIEAQIEKLNKPDVHVNELDAWNLPYSYYSLCIGEKQFFCVNSNSLFADFLSYYREIQKGEPVDQLKNQIVWLVRNYEMAMRAGRMPILVSHHPVYITLGKRIQPSEYDAWHYLSDAQLEEFNKIFSIARGVSTDKLYREISFSDLFTRILDYLQLKFPLTINGHDHFLNLVREGNTSQLTIGGAGGSLHKFVKFNHETSGCQIEQHGFAELSFSLKNKTEQDKIIEIDIYTIEGLHLKFDTTSHLPMRWVKSKAFEVLRNKIVAASIKYYDNIDCPKDEPLVSTQGLWSKGMNILSKGVSKGVSVATSAYEGMTKERPKREPSIVQDIVAYFNQYESPNFIDAYKFLEEKKALLEPFFTGKNSFYSVVAEIINSVEIKKFLEEAKTNSNANDVSGAVDYVASQLTASSSTYRKL